MKSALLPLWPLILWKPELPFSSHGPQKHFALLTADPNSPIAGLHRLSPTDPNQNLHIHRQYHPSVLSWPSQSSLPFPSPSPSPFSSFSQPTHRFSQTREPSRSPSTSAPSTNRPPATALLQHFLPTAADHHTDTHRSVHSSASTPPATSHILAAAPAAAGCSSKAN